VPSARVRNCFFAAASQPDDMVVQNLKAV